MTQTKTFAILSQNLGGLAPERGSWPERMQRLLQFLRREQPDIVALQAVERRRAEDQLLDILTAAPEYEYSHYAELDYCRERSFGCALLSRPQLTNTGTHHFSPSESALDPATRGFAIGLVPCFNITVVSTHLSWDLLEHQRNIEELVALAGRVSTPVVIAGDLNAPPDSPSFLPMQTSGWLDLWSALRTDEGYTFGVGHLSKRIDYFWSQREVLRYAHSIERVLERDGVSDHAGVILRIARMSPEGFS